MRYLLTAILILLLILDGFTQVTTGPANFEVANGQVYLSWNMGGYNVTFTVLRSTTKGGYYEIVAEKLEESKWCDTPPETEKTYYYVIARHDKGTDNEEARTKEIGVYVP